MESHPDLVEWRVEIDEIDKELIFLLARRFKLTEQVGLYKKRHHLNPIDEEREKSQFEKIKNLATAAGLSPEFSEKLLRCIIDEVVSNHRKCVSTQ